MYLCEKLHEDPSIRTLLWCLIGSGELDQATLKACGFSDVEAHAILKDESRKLRELKRRHAMAMRLTVADLAALLRNRLSEHIESAKKSSELSTLLRCLKGLPNWIFPEWEQEELAKLADGKSLELAPGVVQQV
ncbi:MAG: hypothetical protein H7A35_12005 [Planctomycetales bacterium]|nr:hypothetical protein [bacterium]UNM07580.1 MAG: hypothetical protein H7A35_12005 [Planctomycetales bacterium]